MIVIEGMDNSGKTTLAKQLAKNRDYPYVHSPGKSFTWDWIEKALNKEEIVVYDRFPVISEQVYGSVLRNWNRFGSYKGQVIQRKFINKEPLIIYCRPPEEVIFDFGKRKQMEGVIEEKRRILKAYDRVIYHFWGNLDMEVYFYNYRSEYDQLKLNETIKDWLLK